MFSYSLMAATANIQSALTKMVENLAYIQQCKTVYKTRDPDLFNLRTPSPPLSFVAGGRRIPDERFAAMCPAQACLRQRER